MVAHFCHPLHSLLLKITQDKQNMGKRNIEIEKQDVIRNLIKISLGCV